MFALCKDVTLPDCSKTIEYTKIEGNTTNGEVVIVEHAPVDSKSTRGILIGKTLVKLKASVIAI